MRIIGGKDYYDGAAAFGRDTDVVYVREKSKTIPSRECPIQVDTYLENRPRDHEGASIFFHPYLIVVTGACYPMIEVEELSSSRPTVITRAYDSGSFWKASHLSPDAQRNRWDWLAGRNWGAYIAVFFGQKITDGQRDWLISHRITVMHNRYAPISDDRGWMIEPFDLGRLEFQKRLNPYQCHQEIAMWVGGVLPRNPNPMVEITDDKIKVAKHGMDNKWSFRRHREDAK